MKNKSIILITSFLLFFQTIHLHMIVLKNGSMNLKLKQFLKAFQKKLLEVLNNAKPSEKTIKLDRNQPEFKLTFQKYKSKVVSDYRLKKQN